MSFHQMGLLAPYWLCRQIDCLLSPLPGCFLLRANSQSLTKVIGFPTRQWRFGFRIFLLDGLLHRPYRSYSFRTASFGVVVMHHLPLLLLVKTALPQEGQELRWAVRGYLRCMPWENLTVSEGSTALPLLAMTAFRATCHIIRTLELVCTVWHACLLKVKCQLCKMYVYQGLCSHC